MKRANLGCGGQIAEGWDNLDRGCGPGVHCLDMRDGLPYETDELDYAVAHHVLDLFAPGELRGFLFECRRVLKPRGILRISLADTMDAIEAAERNNTAWFDGMGLGGADPLLLLHEYVWLNGARKTFLTRSLAAQALTFAGFTPYIVAFHHTLCDDEAITDLDTRANESIWLEGMA